MTDHDAPDTGPEDTPDGPGTTVRPVDLRDWVDFSRKEARRTRVFATDQLAQDLWCIQPQQATPVLHHPDADVTYTVIAGRSWFVTDQGEIGLDPMGALLVPAGVVHGIDNRGADPLIVSASMAPPGGDPEDQPVADTGAGDPRRRAVRAAAQEGVRRPGQGAGPLTRRTSWRHGRRRRRVSVRRAASRGC
jgi:quercetin dioxygenase-like cupin family protein